MPGKITGLCELCVAKNSVYRCPKCSIMYCSLMCYKDHKEKCQPKELIVSPKTDIKPLLKLPREQLVFNEEVQEQDRLNEEVLARLGESGELKKKLGNDHLKNMLKDIAVSKEPSKLLEQAMQVPLFTEFVDECLKIVEPPDERFNV